MLLRTEKKPRGASQGTLNMPTRLILQVVQSLSPFYHLGNVFLHDINDFINLVLDTGWNKKHCKWYIFNGRKCYKQLIPAESISKARQEDRSSSVQWYSTPKFTPSTEITEPHLLDCKPFKAPIFTVYWKVLLLSAFWGDRGQTTEMAILFPTCTDTLKSLKPAQYPWF